MEWHRYAHAEAWEHISEPDDDGMLDEMADDSPQLTVRSSKNDNSGFSTKSTLTTSKLLCELRRWTRKIPLLDNKTPIKDSIPMRVVPVTSHTNDDTFTKKMSKAD